MGAEGVLAAATIGSVPLSLSALEGQGYNAGVNLGVGSLDYGVGVDWLGLPTSAQYESYGIGIGPGVGVMVTSQQHNILYIINNIGYGRFKKYN